MSEDSPARRTDADPRPRILRILASSGRIAWQFVGVAAAVWVLGQAYGALAPVLLSVFVALVVAAATTPVVQALEARGLGRTLATSVAIGGLVAVLAAVSYGLVMRVVDQAPGLAEDIRSTREPVLDWLEGPPLQLSREEVAALLDRSVSELQGSDADSDAGDTAARVVTGEDTSSADEESSEDESGGQDPPDEDEDLPDDQQGPSPSLAVGVLQQAFGFARITGFVLLGVVLAFFLVRDRDTITDATVANLVGGSHDRVAYVVLRRSWRALLGYVRASLLVGAVDAALIGVVLFVVGVPLAGVLTVLTLFAAFVPVVGAVSVGLLSVAVALVSNGVGAAAVVAVAVLLVQQLDGNVLQPLLMRIGTGLHPVATILALAVGGILGGVLGALLAVPLTAVLVAASAALLESGVGLTDEPIEPPDDADAAPGSG